MELSLASLCDHAQQATARSYTPYSGEPRAAAALLSDGMWTCGVRVESASYSLVIPAATAVVAACVSAGRQDIAAIALSDTARPDELAFLQGTFAGPAIQFAANVFIYGDIPTDIGARLPSSTACSSNFSPGEGIALARVAAGFAYAPLSNFAVGCVIRTKSGRLYRGTNVEHPDWTRGICAERSALSSAISNGECALEELYLSCLKDSTCTPCGACRQLIVEAMPDGIIWMNIGIAPPVSMALKELLPLSFTSLEHL